MPKPTPKAKEAPKYKWVTCAHCGNKNTKHEVLAEKETHYGDEYGHLESTTFHRFVCCLGCETPKMVVSSLDNREQFAEESDDKIYPEVGEPSARRAAAIDLMQRDDYDNELIPADVQKMYIETLGAINAQLRTLAGGGLRAIVEAICKNLGIDERNLEKKIDALAGKNLLTKAQADLLHEERFLGNDALHDMATPSRQELEDGLGIIEGLINTIYILPSKAQRLKEKRVAKKAKKNQ